MKYTRWTLSQTSGEAAASLRDAGYPALLSSVLAARGVGAAQAPPGLIDRANGRVTKPRPVGGKG